MKSKLAIIGVALLVTGCGAAGEVTDSQAIDATPPTRESDSAMDEMDEMTEGGMVGMDGMDDDNHAEVAFGEPGDPSEADRTVMVSTVEDGGFAYDPPEIEVGPGETITFEVTNPGEAVHEFVIGDQAFQKEHEEEMADGDMHMGDEPYSFALEPGETKSLTWTFPDEERDILYACHQPGHYDAGMVGDFVSN